MIFGCLLIDRAILIIEAMRFCFLMSLLYSFIGILSRTNVHKLARMFLEIYRDPAQIYKIVLQIVILGNLKYTNKINGYFSENDMRSLSFPRRMA